MAAYWNTIERKANGKLTENTGTDKPLLQMGKNHGTKSHLSPSWFIS
jgi:hypothetical protein